jgi:hypothetical protein
MTVTYMTFQPQLETALPTNYNCDCDDNPIPTSTLAQLQRRILVRLGFAAMPTPPPGMAELVNDFLQSSQKLLYRQYKCFATERWFSWDLVQGQRFYDIGGNRDDCSKKLDPRKVKWVGISRGDNVWQPLVEGIDPVYYSAKILAIPNFFEIRQCIELWPAPSDNSWTMRIKGDFGLLPFEADADVTTIDSEAIFLHALARAKAHYGQSDAANCQTDCTIYIGKLTSGQHPTHRTWPGYTPIPNAIPPKMVP